MSAWSKQQVLEFIEMYKSFECLWKIKSPEYNNRLLRDQAYQYMIERVTQFDPDANRDYITKKINNLRCSFRKEKKKVERHGKGNYHPRLWYYKYLMFVNNEQEEDSLSPRSSFPNNNGSNNNNTSGVFCVKNEDSTNDDNADAGTLAQDSMLDIQCSEEPDTNLHSDSDADPFGQTDSEVVEPVPKLPKIDRKQTESHVSSRRHQPLHLRRLNDYFDIIGQGISNKLKRLENTQRIFAERLIHEVIFEAELGNLSRGVSLTGFSEEDTDVL